MYAMAVEADDDDDDEISPEAFIDVSPATIRRRHLTRSHRGRLTTSPRSADDADRCCGQVCYVHNLGIGVHPLRREEMVRAALISKGRASP